MRTRPLKQARSLIPPCTKTGNNSAIGTLNLSKNMRRVGLEGQRDEGCSISSMDWARAVWLGIEGGGEGLVAAVELGLALRLHAWVVHCLNVSLGLKLYK